MAVTANMATEVILYSVSYQLRCGYAIINITIV